MGILGNEAADVVAKNAAEKVRSMENHEKWLSGGGIRQWAKGRKRESLEEGQEGVIKRAVGWRGGILWMTRRVSWMTTRRI